MAHVTQPVPTPGSTPAAEAAWAKVRAMGDIQFTPLSPRPAPATPPPQWLLDLIAWLARWIAWLGQWSSPFGRWLVQYWRWIEIGVPVLLGLIVLALVWSIWRAREVRNAATGEAAEWRPDATLARALLADADRLAAEGRYDEAVHLLLRRSFDDIAETRPDWLTPASTAREIARLPALPASARGAFGVIAREVERSRYALDSLAQPDWDRARAAYAAFAVPQRGAPA